MKIKRENIVIVVAMSLIVLTIFIYDYTNVGKIVFKEFSRDEDQLIFSLGNADVNRFEMRKQDILPNIVVKMWVEQYHKDTKPEIVICQEWEVNNNQNDKILLSYITEDQCDNRSFTLAFGDHRFPTNTISCECGFRNFGYVPRASIVYNVPMVLCYETVGKKGVGYILARGKDALYLREDVLVEAIRMPKNDYVFLYKIMFINDSNN